MCNQYSPVDESRTLRDELLQSRKYVFERPLLIITVSIGILNFIEKPYASLLPLITISLLIFNLWFTVNRMRSIARIVAYIQLELEEKSFGAWLGWETCLRYNRRWMKLNKSNVRSIIDSKIEKEAVPDAIGYYPMIYLMHVTVVAVASAGSVVHTIFNWGTVWGTVNIALCAATLLVLSVFLVYAIRCHPRRVKNMIEENRIIWIEVFRDLQKKGIKSTD